MMKIGKLEEVKLRDIWRHEQYDFSEWLSKSENLQILGDILGLSLVEPKTEDYVGSFRCDIVCKDEITNKIILIENQLEPSNHEHLGKAITYSSGLNASVVVWIVESAKEEHASAIEWLNAHSDSTVSFFLIEIHVVKIGNSDPAPLFKIIAQPNDFIVDVKRLSGSEKENIRKAKYIQFWTLFNDILKNKNNPFSIRKPSPDHWHDFSIGSSKCHLCLELVNKEGYIRVSMWINDSLEQYQQFELHKQEIENNLGMKLVWHPLEGKKCFKICSLIEGLDFDNQDNYSSLCEEAIERLIKYRKAFKPYLI